MATTSWMSGSVANEVDQSAGSTSLRVWTRSGTGIYSVIVPNAKAALATAVQLSSTHETISIKDMDGNEVELEVLKAMVEMEGSAFHLVPR